MLKRSILICLVTLALFAGISIQQNSIVYAKIGDACTVDGKAGAETVFGVCAVGAKPTSDTSTTIGDGGSYQGGCDDLSSSISATGFVRQTLCPPGSNGNAIAVIIQNLSNYILGLATFVFIIMVGLGFIQVMTAGGSPEGLKAGKRRILLAVSSIALFAAGRLVLDLIGVTGGNFLGVNVKDGFSKTTIDAIISAVWTYMQFTAGALAVFMVIFGGIQMVTSTGNPQKVAGARKTITYGLVGFLGVLAAGLIFTIIKQILGAS